MLLQVARILETVLGYIEEGEPVNLPLPNRRASRFVQSHFYLDDLPQSTEPLDENPRASKMTSSAPTRATRAGPSRR